MPPKRTSTTRRQPAPKNYPKNVQKNRKLVPPQKSTRSRAVRSLSTSAVNSVLPEPLPEPTTAPQNLTEPPRHRGRKRGYISEDEPSNKRLRKDLQPVLVSSQPLSKANLKKHNRLTEFGTSNEVGTSERGRPLSWPPSSADMERESISSTAANYRFNILSHAGIFIKPELYPEEVQSRINALIHGNISEERKRELSHFAENLYKDSIYIFNGASREDDCVTPIDRTLSLMDRSRNFQFSKKADWNPSLKPSFLPKYWDMSLLDEADNPITQPRKQQEADTSGLFKVKTPRPNITVSLDPSTIVKALATGGLDEFGASEFFLRDLSWQQILSSNPTLQFPIMVVEGKAYATGKTIFEAQNQAAVAGSCMIKLQHELADLTKRASLKLDNTDSEAQNQAAESGSCMVKLELADLTKSVSHRPYNSKAPLAFSICTEGPHMELWVHYTTLLNRVRVYNMNILKTCHILLPDTVTEFLMVVDNMMSWASVEFVNDIAEQLVLVGRAGLAPHLS